MDIIEKHLKTIILQQKKQQDQLDTFNRRLMSIEQSLKLNTHATTETSTHTKRILPYVTRAMTALHKAFQMVANGILNLREETSEFAGNIIESSHDTDYCNLRSV